MFNSSSGITDFEGRRHTFTKKQPVSLTYICNICHLCPKHSDIFLSISDKLFKWRTLAKSLHLKRIRLMRTLKILCQYYSVVDLVTWDTIA